MNTGRFRLHAVFAGVGAFAAAAAFGLVLGRLFGAGIGAGDLPFVVAVLVPACVVGGSWITRTGEGGFARLGMGLAVVWAVIGACALGNAVGNSLRDQVIGAQGVGPVGLHGSDRQDNRIDIGWDELPNGYPAQSLQMSLHL